MSGVQNNTMIGRQYLWCLLNCEKLKSREGTPERYMESKLKGSETYQSSTDELSGAQGKSTDG